MSSSELSSHLNKEIYITVSGAVVLYPLL